MSFTHTVQHGVTIFWSRTKKRFVWKLDPFESGCRQTHTCIRCTAKLVTRQDIRFRILRDKQYVIACYTFVLSHHQVCMPYFFPKWVWNGISKSCHLIGTNERIRFNKLSIRYRSRSRVFRLLWDFSHVRSSLSHLFVSIETVPAAGAEPALGSAAAVAYSTYSRSTNVRTCRRHSWPTHAVASTLIYIIFCIKKPRMPSHCKYQFTVSPASIFLIINRGDIWICATRR